MFILVWIIMLAVLTFAERTSGWLILPVLGWIILAGAFIHMSGRMDLTWHGHKKH